MPEVGIGLFPDVGGSYLLSRLPGALGIYLALTGSPIRAVDAVYVGLADVYVAAESTQSIASSLESLEWTDDARADAGRALGALAVRELPEQQCFIQGDFLEGVRAAHPLANLEHESL
jgi:enoyl-CoA hydratase/carnithine racemase